MPYVSTLGPTAFGRKLTHFYRHPAFHLKCPAFFCVFQVGKKCALCALPSVKWNSDNQGYVADWPTGHSLFLISHPDVRLVNILLSTTRVSLVQNKFVFCQLRVHYIGDPDITKTYLGIQHVNILQYLHELNGNVHYNRHFRAVTAATGRSTARHRST